MLLLKRTSSQSIVIDGNIEVVIMRIDKHQVLLGINAPRDISVHRSEIQEKVNLENLKA